MSVATADECRVLVVAPTGRDGSLMTSFLAAHGIGALECATVQAAATEMAAGAGAILLADEACRDGESAVLSAALGRQPPWSDLPVVLLTFAGSAPAAEDEQLSALGNLTIIERPAGGGPLLSAIQSALRARRRQYEVRQHLRELELAGAELRAASTRKDELLALVSHELRTPLTLIVGSGEVLARRFDELEPGARDELLASVTENGARLKRVIENMLVLAKAETLADVILEPLMVQRVLPPLLESLRPLQGCRDLLCRLPDDLPPVIANSMFFEQIIQNLVRNSEKYADPSRPVEVWAASDGAHVTISVADRGRAFEQEQVDQMFETFYRDPKSALRASGLGLGLPVCRRLAEAQQGTIAAAPRPGGGIVVTLTLPAAAQPWL